MSLGPAATASVTVHEDDPPPPPVRITSITPLSPSKKKGVTGFRIMLSAPVDSASANALGNYAFVQSVKKGKKTITQVIPLASVSYDGETTITLNLSRKLALKGAARLQIGDGSIRDTLGAASTATVTASAGGSLNSTVSKNGTVTIASAGLHPLAVDRVLHAGVPVRAVRRPHR